MKCVTHSLKCVTHSLKCVTHSLKCVTHSLKCVTHSLKCVTHSLKCVTQSLKCITHSLKCVTHALKCVTHSLECTTHHALVSAGVALIRVAVASAWFALPEVYARASPRVSCVTLLARQTRVAGRARTLLHGRSAVAARVARFRRVKTHTSDTAQWIYIDVSNNMQLYTYYIYIYKVFYLC